jgi:hypothetical protein
MLKIRSKDIIMRHRASTIECLSALMHKKKNKKRTKAGKLYTIYFSYYGILMRVYVSYL